MSIELGVIDCSKLSNITQWLQWIGWQFEFEFKKNSA